MATEGHLICGIDLSAAQAASAEPSPALESAAIEAIETEGTRPFHFAPAPRVQHSGDESVNQNAGEEAAAGATSSAAAGDDAGIAHTDVPEGLGASSSAVADDDVGIAHTDVPEGLGAGARAGLPAAVLVHTALGSEANLDFPQITEICERLEAEPAELDEAVNVLAVALAERGQASSRVKLKALTIANEMTYDDAAVEAFRASPGLREALQQLRGARGSGLGAVTDENVRMLATEVDRVCFGQIAAPGAPALTEPLLAGLQQVTSEGNLERLERARQKAQKSFSLFGKRAEKTMQKAAKAVDTTANKVMQEAERTWDQLVGVDAPSALQPRQEQERLHGFQRLQQQRPATAEEEEHYMQLALSASLEEAKQRDAAEGTKGGHTPLLWRVVSAKPLNVRSKKCIEAEVLGYKQPGDRFRGVQVGDWVALADEPGFIVISGKVSGRLFLQCCGEAPRSVAGSEGGGSNASDARTAPSEAEEASGSVSTAASAAAASQGSAGETPVELVGNLLGDDLLSFMQEVSTRSDQMTARAEAAESGIKQLVRAGARAARDDEDLLQQFEDGEAILSDLTQRLSEAEFELERAQGRAARLQASLAEIQGGARVSAAALVPRLRARVAELEELCRDPAGRHAVSTSIAGLQPSCSTDSTGSARDARASEPTAIEAGAAVAPGAGASVTELRVPATDEVAAAPASEPLASELAVDLPDVTEQALERPSQPAVEGCISSDSLNGEIVVAEEEATRAAAPLPEEEATRAAAPLPEVLAVASRTDCGAASAVETEIDPASGEVRGMDQSPKPDEANDEMLIAGGGSMSRESGSLPTSESASAIARGGGTAGGVAATDRPISEAEQADGEEAADKAAEAVSPSHAEAASAGTGSPSNAEADVEALQPASFMNMHEKMAVPQRTMDGEESAGSSASTVCPDQQKVST